jgi:hypothetical protein
VSAGSNNVSAADAAYITRLLHQEVADDFAAMQRWRDALQTAVNDVIIKRLEPVFNEALTAAPQSTPAQKQELCQWVNAELHNMGLAIRCPRTGEPAALRVEQGRDSASYQIQIEALGGHAVTPIESGSTLEELELCVAPWDALAHGEGWTQKVTRANPEGRRRK